jgi:hypothetical protein
MRIVFDIISRYDPAISACVRAWYAGVRISTVHSARAQPNIRPTHKRMDHFRLGTCISTNHRVFTQVSRTKWNFGGQGLVAIPVSIYILSNITLCQFNIYM